jgi:hypothetical protein
VTGSRKVADRFAAIRTTIARCVEDITATGWRPTNNR